MEAILLIIDAQSTDLEVICQTMYEQEVQNMVMLRHA
jgi:hypothetical protein